MDIEQIRELVKILEESTLSELSVSEGNLNISLKREMQQAVSAAAPVVVQKETPVEEEEEDVYIMSPMVGTFYNSPSPDDSSFINVGDIVHKGQVLCIIEAMKLMNEIECEYDAEIISIMVSNEQRIEYGQPLFKIRKL